MKPGSQSVHQPDLAGIAERIRSGVEADPHVKSDDGTDPRKLSDGDRGRHRSLDPRELRGGQPGGATDLTQGEPR